MAAGLPGVARLLSGSSAVEPSANERGVRAASSNSVVEPGKETKALGEVAADHELVIVIGVNEKVESGPGNGTLYNSLLTFDADGSSLIIIVNLFRHTRSVWYGGRATARG